MAGCWPGFVCAFAAGVVLAAAGSVPTAAAQDATVCGKKDDKGQVVRGTLSLDGDQSTVNVAYKRSASARTYLLIFKVDGCQMPVILNCPEFRDDSGQPVKKGDKPAPCPATAMLPKGGGDEIPHGVVKTRRVQTDPGELSLRMSVAHGDFDPGSYAGAIEVRAPYVATTRTPVTLSRSDSSLFWPMFIGVGAGAVALLWYWIQRAVANVRVRVSRWWVVVALLAGALAGALSAYTAWRNQDVWSLGENGAATAIAAFTGATTGALTVFLGNIWEPVPPKPEDKKKRARAATVSEEAGAGKV